MHEDLQSWIALGVVAVTIAAFAARWIIRRKKRKSGGCGSGGCSCPAPKPPRPGQPD